MQYPEVIGIGSAFVDYFFDVDDQFLDSVHLSAQHSRAISDDEFAKTFSSLPLLAKSPGGSTPITLAVLEQLGIAVSYNGIIGEDEEGIYWENTLQAIDKHIKKQGKTAKSACLLSNARKDRSFLYTLNKKENNYFNYVNYSYINSAKFLHITPFYTNYKTSFDQLIEMATHINGPKISFCPALVYASLGLEKLKIFFKKTSIIYFSKEEIKLLFSDVEKGSMELLSYGPEIVICTLGEKGVLVTTKETQFVVKAKKVKKIIDTTGAGDAFAAGFLYGMLKNKSVEWSAHFANAIASDAVTDFGLQWLDKVNAEKIIRTF